MEKSSPELTDLGDEIAAVLEERFGERLRGYGKVVLVGNEDQRLILTSAPAAATISMLVYAIGRICEEAKDPGEHRELLDLISKRILSFAQAAA